MAQAVEGNANAPGFKNGCEASRLLSDVVDFEGAGERRLGLW